MGKSYKTKIKEFYLKLKTIKNIEIIIAVIVIALIILLYSLISVNKKNDVKISSAVNEKQEMSLTAEVERKLTEVLSQIDGAGKVKVMITYSSSPEKIIANTKSTHTNTTSSSGSVTTSTSTVTETPIIISSSGKSELYIIKEIMPQVVGVIVVAGGADNARVRLDLMRAVQTILNINANSIEIFAMK